MRFFLLAISFIAFSFFNCSNHKKENINDYAIKSVNLFDGENYRENVTIVIRDGYIFEIDTTNSEITSTRTIIHGEGKTIIPPLLNAHVHVWEESNLKEALDAGVFGLFDMHTTDEAANYLRTFRDSSGYA